MGRSTGTFFAARKPPLPWRPTGPLGEDYRCQAILYGTTTMLGGFADGPAPACPRQGAPLPKEDSVNPQGQQVGQFVVSVDPKGSLAFSGPVLERKGRPAAHVIEAVTEQGGPGLPDLPAAGGGVPSSPGRRSWTAPCCWRSWRPGFGVQRLMVAGGNLRTTLCQLRPCMRERAVLEAIDALLVLDVRGPGLLHPAGIHGSAHAGGGAFASDPAVMGWLFQQ